MIMSKHYVEIKTLIYIRVECATFSSTHILNRGVMLATAVTNMAGGIESTARIIMFSLNCCRSLGILCYTLAFNIPHNQKSGGDKNGLLEGRKNQNRGYFATKFFLKEQLCQICDMWQCRVAPSC